MLGVPSLPSLAMRRWRGDSAERAFIEEREGCAEGEEMEGCEEDGACCDDREEDDEWVGFAGLVFDSTIFAGLESLLEETFRRVALGSWGVS